MKGYTLQFCKEGSDNWRQVTARPHGERHDFHPETGAIRFNTEPEAIAACKSYSLRNAAIFLPIAISRLSEVELKRWFPS